MDYKLDQRFRRVVDILGLDQNDLFYPHVPEKVMFLYDWAEARAKSTNMIDVLRKIEGLRKDMGIMLRGRPLLTDMYKWTKIDALKIKERMLKEEARESAEEKETQEKAIKRTYKEKVKAWEGVKESYEEDKRRAEMANTRKVNYLKRVTELDIQKNKGESKVKDVTQTPTKP